MSTMPHSIEAEAGALACVLISNGHGGELLDQLEEKHFYDDRHLVTLRGLLALHEDSQPLDVVALMQRLKDDEQLDSAGGWDYIQRLPDQTPSVENFLTFRDIVQDRATRRDMISEANRLKKSAHDLSAPVESKLPKSKLPAWADVAKFCAADCPTPPEIIGGILHQGCKLVIGGSTKARKTWALLDLALAVSTGDEWLKFKTAKARVLFVNFELPEFSIHHRLRVLAESRHISVPRLDNLCLWNLRGHSASYEILLPLIIERAKRQNFGLVILDPSYKLLGQADENSARDIALLLNSLESLTAETGAALAFSAHFAKGGQAHKEAMDRISGSGVFARDPDSILVFTALQTPDAYAVESILRTLPPQCPFSIRWEYPNFQVADLDPSDLKQPQRGSLKPTPTRDEVLSLFTENATNPRIALLTAVQLRALFDVRGWDRVSAPAIRDSLVADGKLKVYHGAHNAKLTGLPSTVDAYTKQQSEADTILEQTALPASPGKTRKPRRK